MRIGIDGLSLRGSSITGVGRVLMELCEELDTRLPTAEFYVYSNENIQKPVINSRWSYRIDNEKYKSWRANAWLRFRCGSLCQSDKIDLFWGASSFLSASGASIKKVITVHDLNFLYAPETMPLTNRLWFRFFFPCSVKKADQIVCVSKGTAERLILWKPDLQAKVQVISNAVSEFFVPESDLAVTQSVLKRLNIKAPFILAVATWEPRKNLDKLVKAFKELKSKGELESVQLVLVGKLGWKYGKISEEIETQPDWLVLPGFVSDSDLRCLYSSASLFALPSRYEGFGLPAAEAMACGCPVLCSDIPELHEATGGLATYCRPDGTDLPTRILEAIEKGKIGNEFRPPRWAEMAGQYAKLFETLVPNHQLSIGGPSHKD